LKLLYGTRNPAKLEGMRSIVKGLGIEIIGLDDINLSIDKIDESGNNPLENAKIKALEYYEATKMPVFSCDSGLFIEGLSFIEQPGVHVRRVNGKELSDEEMIEYYSNLALKHGGNLKAKYKNAICLVVDENNLYEYDGDDISSESFIISSKPHSKRTPGFPLNSLSVEIKTRKYYLDIGNKDKRDDNALDIGFRNFFIRTFEK